MLSYALIAGLSLSEAKHLRPGMVCDLYIYRRKYDDEQHGLRREVR